MRTQLADAGFRSNATKSILHVEDADLTNSAIRLLDKLATNKNGQVEVCSQAVDAVIHAMNKYTADAELQLVGCAALTTLAGNGMGIALLRCTLNNQHDQ